MQSLLPNRILGLKWVYFINNIKLQTNLFYEKINREKENILIEKIFQFQQIKSNNNVLTLPLKVSGIKNMSKSNRSIDMEVQCIFLTLQIGTSRSWRLSDLPYASQPTGGSHRVWSSLYYSNGFSKFLDMCSLCIKEDLFIKH